MCTRLCYPCPLCITLVEMGKKLKSNKWISKHSHKIIRKSHPHSVQALMVAATLLTYSSWWNCLCLSITGLCLQLHALSSAVHVQFRSMFLNKEYLKWNSVLGSLQTIIDWQKRWETSLTKRFFVGFGGYEISFYKNMYYGYKKHLTVGCFYSQWELCNKNVHLFLVHPGFHCCEFR